MTAPALRAPATGGALDERLAQEQGTLITRAMTATVLAAIAVLAGLIGASALILGSGRWLDLPAALPLLLAVIAVVATGLTFRLRWDAERRALQVPALARTIEREQQLREGSLQGALEVSATGPLGARAASDVARHLTPGTLAPHMAKRLLQVMIAAGAMAAVAVALVGYAARVAPDGLRAVLQPVSAWRGTLLPALAFDRLPSGVPRGMPVTLRIVAAGRREITVSRQAEGEAWRDSTVTVPDDGRVSFALGPMRARTTVRVNDGRAPELSAVLTVEDRGWIGDVSLRAIYPAYLARAEETLEPVPPLRVPRGTRIRVHAVLRGGARNATLGDGRTTVALFAGAATGDGVPADAEFVVDRDGTWRWQAEATPRADGAVLPPELPDALPFTVIPDRAPDVRIVAPATDTAIGPTGVVPVLVDADDDHGVARVHLVLWKESAAGAGVVQRERIEVATPGVPLFEGGATITLDGRKLEPGDRLHVTAVATDDSPWAQQAQSAEIVLRMPTLSEQRAMARSLADSLAAQAQQLAQQEKRLQQNTTDAARSRDLKGGGNEQGQGGSQQNQAGKGQMSFSQAEKAKQLAKDQQQLSQKIDSLRMNAKELESRLKNANALDTALAGRMRDIQKMLRDALTPEMQKQLEALNKNAERLSGTEAQQSMQQLAEAQKQMRQQLEKSAEMLKRAALEGAMQTLRDDAKDLAKEQRELAEKMGGKPGPQGNERASQDPRSLAERSRDLEQEVQSLAKRLEEAGAKPGASKTREAQPLAKQAADEMQKAAQSARQNQQPGQQGQQGQQQQGQQQANQQQANQQQGQAGQQQAGQQQQAQRGNEAAQQRAQQGAQQQGQGQKTGGEQGNQNAGNQGQPQPGANGQGGQGGQAGSEQARRAADAMEKAAQQLAQARDAQVNAWKGELSEQLDQSINETMQLARQQAELEQRMKQAGQQGAQQMQGEQSALQQGVQQAAERLEEAGRSSSLLSQRSQKAMGEAQRRVQQATQAMQQAGQGQPGGGQQAQSAMKDATEALNQALSSLVRDRERVNNANSASGFTEMMEQLKQLAQQQGQLNSQMQGLNMLPGGQRGDQAQQQARVLARQQREVARSLTDVSDADETGRTDALAKEAAQLAQQIERSGLDPNVAARQQALYRRLLDAGRFLEQDERDDQGPREAKAATGNGATGRVDGAQSGKAANRFAPPTWNELRGLGPEERRIVIEYFRRLNGSTPP